MGLASFSMSDRTTDDGDKAHRANGFMANTVGNVSLPSAAHHLHLIGAKFSAVSEHPYGWSFCDKDTTTADVEVINHYLAAIRDFPNVTPQEDVEWSWNNAIDQRVEFTVNNRVYSTHEVPGHSQLYPLKGTGVHYGIGPIDMAKKLIELNEISDRRKVKLYQVYAKSQRMNNINMHPFSQLGTTQKKNYKEAMDALISS